MPQDDMRAIARTRHKDGLRAGCLYSIHALGWVTPYLGLPLAWIKVAHKVLEVRPLRRKQNGAVDLKRGQG